jgi:UDP-N-acetylmuramate--alanine ligase
VGIGGIGMSGIAELLANLGYAVSGSDTAASDVTRRLETLGVRVYQGHAPSHVGDADVLVVSSAVAATNPEVVEARARRTPVIPRAEMLAELMRLRQGIAVAGAHGKTSTTSMIALVLDRAGLDPTAVIGGRLSAFGSNARLGRGQYMVVEADESDGSFLKLSPVTAVVTNIDREHLDHYGSLDRLLDAFVEFANKVPFYGAVVACADDPHLRELRPRMTRRVVTYGLDSADADLRGNDVVLGSMDAHCTVTATAGGHAARRPGALGALRLRVPGRHNLLNALAAVGVGLELGLTFEQIAGALEEFQGAERRYQVVGEVAGVRIVDDYGHHPTEIAAVLASARASVGRRVVVVFQPHRYTRTRDLLDEFGRVLAGVDVLVLTDIYGAGEPPIAGITIDRLAESVRAAGGHEPEVVMSLAELPSRVAAIARSGDLVITLGAGSIGTVAPRIVDAIAGTPTGSGSVH